MNTILCSSFSFFFLLKARTAGKTGNSRARRFYRACFHGNAMVVIMATGEYVEISKEKLKEGKVEDIWGH